MSDEAMQKAVMVISSDLPREKVHEMAAFFAAWAISVGLEIRVESESGEIHGVAW